MSTIDNIVTEQTYCSFEDLSKIDIRIGEIVEAEIVPKSKKLLKLKIYFGAAIGHRTILASLATSYDVTMLHGIRVMAVVNLAPREMMGIQSQGMILAAYQEDGKLSLATCNGVPHGAQIG